MRLGKQRLRQTPRQEQCRTTTDITLNINITNIHTYTLSGLSISLPSLSLPDAEEDKRKNQRRSTLEQEEQIWNYI